ncbi:MAG TPA: prephenate dehydratase [Bryobacteraceae bacterium]|nr:prephenate dehydratase [Bryobacteraceae bacterium]
MKKIRASFQGELGAFSQIALRQLLGEKAEPVPCERFDQAFRALTGGEVNAAVIPFENTLHGSVHENYDHLLQFDLRIVGETSVRIVHNLIVPPGVKWKDMKRVFSHPVALNQCLDFFTAHPGLQKTSFYDTAGSVKMLMAGALTDAGAIASSMAAEIYGARILKRSIEDDRQNFTRFFLLQRKTDKPLIAQTGEKKTSLVFTTRNTPGALFRSLSAFALRDLSLTKIESRPLRGKPWEYLFYVDLLADVEETRTQKAIGHLEELADFLKVFGCYPRGR